jgi:A/G-specific adenine glycosylase
VSRGVLHLSGFPIGHLRVASTVQKTIPPRRGERLQGQRGAGRRLPATTIDPMNPILLQKLRIALLRWFDHHRRNLPWRRNRDPYRIWVSEIMLQQTRVAAVLGHYGKFMARFPNVRSLARARPATVLAAWSGLGYYRRVRLMHAAARKIVREWQGRFPRSSAEWFELPGIGRYTASAIASICYNETCAVVDGNVERLLRRLLGTAAGETWATANQILSPQRPGDFNQAMMELGALVCTPRAPRCKECPLRKWCVTAKGTAQPLLRTRQRRHRAELTYALVTDYNRVLLTRRPDTESVMPGMLELPEFDSGSRLAMPSVRPYLNLKHAIMNTDYTVRVMQVPTPRSAKTGPDVGHRQWTSSRFVSSGRWFQAKGAGRLPLTGLARKILKRTGII